MLNQIQIIAHRGSSRKFKENTIEAFVAALETGCSVLEVDICMPRDGTLILEHDNINENTGIDISETFYNGKQLTLNEFLRKFSPLPVQFIFDVKDFTQNTYIIQKLMETISLFKVCNRSTIASLNENHLLYLRDYGIPTIKTALISGGIESDFFKNKISKYEVDYLIVSIMHLTKELVKNVDVPVLVHTVNTYGLLEYCRRCGVDGIFTDIPDKFLQ